MEYGEGYATLTGAEQMPLLYAGNLDTQVCLKNVDVALLSFYLLLGAIARDSAAFGLGTAPIIQKTIMCSGLEQMLIECPSSNVQISSCRSAAVECQTGKVFH